MEMIYAVQRYAATRPWAKRVGQLYAREVQQTAAQQQVQELVGRELTRAAQVYPAVAARTASEQRLADAYGQFCRHGKLMAHLEDGLMQALRHTRAPGHLPDRLQLPAAAFYLHVDGAEGGAFVMQMPGRQEVALLLLRADFSLAGADWLADVEDSLALQLAYPGELAAPLAAVAAPWRGLLTAVLNGLALMTQPRLLLVRGWEGSAPSDSVALAMHPACAKSRQKGRSQLLQAGYQEVSYCRLDGVATLPGDYATPGYWRRQAVNDAQGGARLVWVMPR
ncbi:hypothetical protein [Aquitalea magnusonii]|uniref:Uncharacterized protein n=1 Tax=Aquitalea magnusonii TaxID=332411 RepID=A0A318JL20_9NEIS|nr:hypothetical protein [Aquitalea magnusonii]PXX50442.1 hypothetical protein DFR38_10289 [Aquitalea magnusonii]